MLILAKNQEEQYERNVDEYVKDLDESVFARSSFMPQFSKGHNGNRIERYYNYDPADIFGMIGEIDEVSQGLAVKDQHDGEQDGGDP